MGKFGGQCFLAGYPATFRGKESDGKVRIRFDDSLGLASDEKEIVAGELRLPIEEVDRHNMTVKPEFCLQNPPRRRLGWKPSHDIPRRREGFHHTAKFLVNRVTRESERQS